MISKDFFSAYLHIKSKSQDKKKKPQNPFRKTSQYKKTIALRSHNCNTKFLIISQFNTKFNSIPQFRTQ